MSRRQAAVRDAYRAACLAELDALKPGNVHRFAPGHDMTVEDFTRSAEVTAPLLADPGLAVGEAIYHAVEATRRAVSCNTNLGLLLLCAPLAKAALAEPVSGEAGDDLRVGLVRVLARLDRQDADFAFRAIRLAEPGGLGSSARHDVRRPARVDLRTAMAEAGERDRIAAQYVTGFADIFGFGLPRLRACRAGFGKEDWAVTAVYLGFLARFVDSHVARKLGPESADALRVRVSDVEGRFRASAEPESFRAELLALDRALKAEGINPGTSADLTVATLFADYLEAPRGTARDRESGPT